MRRFMVHGGERYEISPFSVWVDDLKKSPKEIETKGCELLDLWEAVFKWVGGNDTAYREFLRWNGLHDLDSFNDETLAEATFETTEDDPQIDRTVVYGDLY